MIRKREKERVRMCAFTRESARSVTGGGRCREGRGGDRSVRSSFEQGGLRIRIVRRVRESRACAFSREELAVSRYNIYTNERAQNRERFIAVSIDERTNERSNELASDDDDDSGVDSHGYRDATTEVVRESRGSARDDDLGPSSVPVPVLEEERGAGSTERATERLIS